MKLIELPRWDWDSFKINNQSKLRKIAFGFNIFNYAIYINGFKFNCFEDNYQYKSLNVNRG